MEGLISLTKKTTPSNYHYICEKNGGSLSDKVLPVDLAGRLLKLISYSLEGSDKFCLRLTQMDELACFAPGMLALGASGYGPENSEQIMNLAKEVNTLGNPRLILKFSSLCILL